MTKTKRKPKSKPTLLDTLYEAGMPREDTDDDKLLRNFLRIVLWSTVAGRALNAEGMIRTMRAMTSDDNVPVKVRLDAAAVLMELLQGTPKFARAAGSKS